MSLQSKEKRGFSHNSCSVIARSACQEAVLIAPSRVIRAFAPKDPRLSIICIVKSMYYGKENEEYTEIYRTLVILWQDGFFREPKSMNEVMKEITKPSPTSAEIYYGKQELTNALFALERKGMLESKKFSRWNSVFVHRKSPKKCKLGRHSSEAKGSHFPPR